MLPDGDATEIGEKGINLSGFFLNEKKKRSKCDSGCWVLGFGVALVCDVGQVVRNSA